MECPFVSTENWVIESGCGVKEAMEGGHNVETCESKVAVMELLSTWWMISRERLAATASPAWMALMNVRCIHHVEGSVDEKMDSQADHNELGKCPADIHIRAKEKVWCVVMIECKSVILPPCWWVAVRGVRSQMLGGQCCEGMSPGQLLLPINLGCSQQSSLVLSHKSAPTPGMRMRNVTLCQDDCCYCLN